MGTRLERVFLILLLLYNFGSQAPGMLQQGAVGIFGFLFSLGFTFLFVLLLAMASAKGALFLSLFASLALALSVSPFFITKPQSGTHPGLLSISLHALIALTAAYSSFDLWSKWRRPR